MLIPPKYSLTPQISGCLQSIEACKAVIDSIQIPIEVETNIRRQSVLKSSLFSARIEGNPLTLEELPLKGSTNQKKKEVMNILNTMQFIHQRGFRDLTVKTLLETHQKVLQGLIEKERLGKFRTELNAIFNSAGIAIYLPPPPRQVPTLVQRILKVVNSSKEPFVPIKASLAHYSFEKVHPFMDGNGRVGRILLQAVLEKGGYGMKGLLHIEEYLDNHRSSYYDSLMEPEKDVTDYLEFMLQALASASEQAKQQVLQKEKLEAEDFLLPRRAELYRIIKEQRLINFDSIHRRFLKINDRTLRYDLKKLQDQGFIRKRGTTKGVYYEAIQK